MNNFVKTLLRCLSFVGVAVLAACSNKDYINTIPSESTALISVDLAKMTGVNNNFVLKTLFKVSSYGDCGVDVSRKIYFFECADGNMGLCASVDNAGNLRSSLAKAGCEVVSKRGYDFAMVNGSWLAGFSDDALLVMGPVTAAAAPELQNRMARYLSQSEDNGIAATPLFAKLDSLSSPMAMVAQAHALPDQFVTPFMLGVPKDADASQVMIAAEMSVKSGVMFVDGSTFSFNRKIDKAIREAHTVYRPIAGRYLSAMPSDAVMGLFVNVDGNKFIELMRSNRSLQAMLAGINAAIDMDNIIKSVDGDMAVITPKYLDDRLSMSMAAELAHAGWLSDVDYWKQSVPQGGRIIDWKENAYKYTDGKTTFCFGVSADKQFYSGSSPEDAMALLGQSETPISKALQQKVKGQKMALVINIGALTGGNASAVASVLSPVFGNFKTIVYTQK